MKIKMIEKTSEQAFQNRNKRKKEAEREKSRKISFKKQAEQFLDSDTPASNATKFALALVVAAAALSAVCVAPGLTVVARQYKRAKYYSDKQIRDAGQNLKRHGYVEEIPYSGKTRIRLTKKGQEYFHNMLFEESRLTMQEKWDGKWRFLIFDIPIKYAKARAALRWKIKSLDFFQYQKSVWVYPYPCKDEMLFVADQYGVGKYVEVIEATGISNDAALKKHFELP